MSTSEPATPPIPSAWAPLHSTVFRSLWIAVLVSNIGTFMQTVGAQWLLVEQPNASTLVSLVQTASFLPVLLLALPSGALADAFDRRRLLLSVQLFQCGVGVALTALTATGHMPPALLLTLTFALGIGQALTLPAWQALIPDLVPRPLLASASALGSISINLARSVGPAIAGLLISLTDVSVVFAVNTLSFAVFALALLLWRTGSPANPPLPERFTAAVRAGGRYVRHSPVVRRILLRSALFVVPGSALWALLPLVARGQLHLGAGGYGMLLAALGVGAILGATVLQRVRARLTGSQLLLIAGVGFGLALTVIALVPSTVLVTLVLLPAGMAWMTVMSSINAAMQLFLPGWVRGRGLSVYQIVFASGQALGALAWGALADVTTIVTAFLIAGAVMLAGAATIRFWPLHDVAALNRDPAIYWPEPNLALAPDLTAGPILVSTSYEVLPERHGEFVAAMEAVRRSRQRTGAIRWSLYRDGESSDRFVEIYQVPTWDEHLRQHGGRMTVADQEAEQRARALVEGAPVVSHLLPTDVPTHP